MQIVGTKRRKENSEAGLADFCPFVDKVFHNKKRPVRNVENLARIYIPNWRGNQAALLVRGKNRKFSVAILLEKAKKPPLNFQKNPENDAKHYDSYRENFARDVENSVENVKNSVETGGLAPDAVENSVKKVKSSFCLVE